MSCVSHMLHLMPSSWKQVLDLAARGKSTRCSFHYQNKIFQTGLSRHPSPYNLSQIMKLLFPGLIFPQPSSETMERPFSFHHILIFAYWLWLQGPQATKGYEQSKFSCVLILLETEQKYWFGRLQRGKKVSKLLFLSGICECRDFISFG